MFRIATRSIPRAALSRSPVLATGPRRFLSSASPADRSRSWKSSAARWTLAIGAVYYYNTSDVFADTPAQVHGPPESTQGEDSLPTIEELAAERKRSAATDELQNQSSTIAAPEGANVGTASPGELEEEADQQGAFNPETGEINWDCPCLGGMAHGPCGEEFKAAFSCFVYSTEEPKGMDCIDKFKGMQDCFRLHPDVYGAELDDEGEDEDHEVELGSTQAPGAAEHLANSAQQSASPTSASDSLPAAPDPAQRDSAERKQRAKEAKEQVQREHEPMSESEEAVPKAWHDERDENRRSQ